MKTARLAVILSVALIVLCQNASADSGEYWPGAKFEVRAPSELGIDSKKLTAMEDHIVTSLPLLTSVLIMKNGYIAYEEYFSGEMDDLRNLHSQTKSVVSILLGIHLGEEWKDIIDMPITALLPELDPTGSSPASRISTRNVLTMSSGLPDDGGAGVLDPELIKSMVSQKHETSPGEVFAYCGTNPNIISIALTRRTNKSAAEYAEEMLFKPLGIEEYYWQQTNDFSNGAYGLSLRTRDMGRIGYLYLRKGKWRDKQVVPESWVVESTKSQIAVNETGVLTQYGLLWWIGNFAGHPGFFAFGYGGQAIAVIPDQDTVVVITTTDYGIPDKYISIVGTYVVPASLD